jgi:hypothetical protein
MSMQSRNRGDTRRYAAAEDAFTSEGGYLALEDETPGMDDNTDREARYPSRDIGGMARRYAAGMSAVLTAFRGSGSRPAMRPANPPAP